MSSTLPVNLANLLHGRGVEWVRVEFKATWDADTTGPQVLKTICAFANDYHNLNGGYVVIGVAEHDGRARLPPEGLSPAELEAAQRWLRGNCSRLDPQYQPLLSPELVSGRHILVVWAPASQVRPHRAPDGPRGPLRYWLRLGADTVDAEQRGGLLRELIGQTARVPWDDRRAVDAGLTDLHEMAVREHLHEVGSGLIEENDAVEIYRRMGITMRVNDHDVPRNVGLLFFAAEPTRWFRGAWIDCALFAAGGTGDVQEEQEFRGGLARQVRNCLRYLYGRSPVHLRKEPDRIEARRWRAYPEVALRETLVNALYHRGYGPDVPDPTKVYLYPDRLEVVSYPGPVPGLEPQHFAPHSSIPTVPARNRRIGEFLKEIGLAEARLTGLRKVAAAMAANGSPAPRYDFDDGRTYFRVTLPAHPQYAALAAVRDAAELRAMGDAAAAHHLIESAWGENRTSAALAAELIRSHAARGEIDQAERVLGTFAQNREGADQEDAADMREALALVDALRRGRRD
ncbi:MAG: putative DNA binding domain-containing protein [Spirochaetaceae bacterium]|nr:putative DNA binding domain-containing protein [Spirochaetaceae bacterium]